MSSGGVSQVLLSVTAGLFTAGEVRQAVKRRRTGSRVDTRAEVTFRVAFLGAVLALPLAQAVAPWAHVGGGVLAWCGALVAWGGLALRWWAFATLGRWFTVVVRVSSDQDVVDRGPYRWLRHPSYTGLLATFLGIALLLGNLVGVVVSPTLLLVALVGRIRSEERILVETLGDAYRRYATTRARLVPRIW